VQVRFRCWRRLMMMPSRLLVFLSPSGVEHDSISEGFFVEENSHDESHSV